MRVPRLEPVHQRVRAWRRGQLVVDTRRAHLYFPAEDIRHPRRAVPREDLRVPSGDRVTVNEFVVLSADDGDVWVEEDRVSYGAPRNPYHRVDCYPSTRRVAIHVDGDVIAESSRPVLLVETHVPPIWYVPPGDVSWPLLVEDAARTICQYRGEANYFRVRGGDVHVWSYRHPEPEMTAIAGHIAAPGEHSSVRILVDGHLEVSR